MQYKLTAEQIREKAKSIALQVGSGEWQTNAILTLIEAATGEKIPEPFDESNVRHGSAWGRSQDVVVLADVCCTDNMIGIRAKDSLFNPGQVSDGGFGKKSKAEMIDFIKHCNPPYRYLGQYDFSAGLPKQ